MRDAARRCRDLPDAAAGQAGATAVADGAATADGAPAPDPTARLTQRPLRRMRPPRPTATQPMLRARRRRRQPGPMRAAAADGQLPLPPHPAPRRPTVRRQQRRKPPRNPRRPRSNMQRSPMSIRRSPSPPTIRSPCASGAISTRPWARPTRPSPITAGPSSSIRSSPRAVTPWSSSTRRCRRNRGSLWRRRWRTG